MEVNYLVVWCQHYPLLLFLHYLHVAKLPKQKKYDTFSIIIVVYIGFSMIAQ